MKSNADPCVPPPPLPFDSANKNLGGKCMHGPTKPLWGFPFPWLPAALSLVKNKCIYNALNSKLYPPKGRFVTTRNLFHRKRYSAYGPKQLAEHLNTDHNLNTDMYMQFGMPPVRGSRYWFSIETLQNCIELFGWEIYTMFFFLISLLQFMLRHLARNGRRNLGSICG